MIQNPLLKAYRYDPYGKVITAEGYDTEKMKANRLAAIQQASSAKTWGVILGTLGRQGSPKIFNRLRALLRLPGGGGRRCVLFLMAELNPLKLAAIQHIDAWVQVSCPRLSIDWGAGFVKVS
jgi:2-(3-amino-3-carboxypropyl)histidine synthase